jgi:5-oxoprolinase (ATP-hydrolysing)/N-methylhydantoinase A
MTIASQRFRLGVDIGGTFTDFVLFDAETQSTRLHKCLTTPDDPSIGALHGFDEIVRAASLDPAELGEIVHGTTLVTNALIERRGAATGLLTTQGFRDILEIGTEQRYDIYDLFLRFPAPLVDRAHRLEIAERMTADGESVLPLDERGVRMAAEQLVAEGTEAIAICFMHAYRNPAHERRARQLVLERFPALSVSISSDVVAEINEYPRFVTTAANAYVQPLISRYLERFERELEARGFTGAFRLMQSAGGLVSVEAARALPIRLLESGPAGGALASAWFGRAAGESNVLAFDMGGTTAKACLIEDGMPHIAPQLETARVHRFKNGSGLPIKAPVVDMIEIGAGGGSIAAIDEVGLLRVGPRSAGADPGPACYGRGGSEPTVTDASLALGYYDPDFFLGGRMALDLGAAERALERRIAAPLGLSVTEAAWGVHQVVAEAMAGAARIHLVEKGKDPRDSAMIGFGGAGPAFAAPIAHILGIREVIIPPASGAASAFGFLSAPLAVDLVRSLPVVLDESVDLAAVEAVFETLTAEGRAQLAAAGIAATDMTAARSADMRLVGQLHVITVPLPQAPLTQAAYGAIRAAFESVYTARYTQVPTEARLEILSFRIRVTGPVPPLALHQSGMTDGRDTTALKGTRRAYFSGGFVEANVYDRYALAAGTAIEGPALIEERESTTILPPGDRLTVDAIGNLRLEIAAAERAPVRIGADTAVDAAAALIEADPVTLEIMWSRLVTVAEEMWSTVIRTAFSLIISESQDFGCALLTADGETLAHSARVMPVFNLTLPNCVREVLRRYPAETLEPGDVLITNDPWLCAGHLFDLAIITPVFFEGRVVALMGTVGHVGDIGGNRDGMSVAELYEEGLQIPPMKLVKRGVENEDLFRLIGENVRDGEQVLGDVRSLIAANATGAARLVAFMREYGLADLRALAQVVQSRSEVAMRAAIRALPDGVYRSTITNNPTGTPMTFPVAVRVAGDAIEVDFAGAPPQTARGGINCTLTYTTAHATYPLKCMLTPSVRGNAGCYRPFAVKAPKGSILNCDKPAAVSLRTRTGWYIAPNIFRAMAGTAGDLVQSFSALPSLLSIYGKAEDGALFYDMLLLGGGQGGSNALDGKSSLLWPTSAATASIELLENRVPVLVWEKALILDSAGPGRQRGGLGVRVRLARRKQAVGPLKLIVAPEGIGLPIEGLFGGQAGATAGARILDGDGRLVEELGPVTVVLLADASRQIELRLSGGSGFGDPRERDPAAIDDDVRQGYVSPAAAAQHYRRLKQAV